jgi:hypothetical protein
MGRWWHTMGSATDMAPAEATSRKFLRAGGERSGGTSTAGSATDVTS